MENEKIKKYKSKREERLRERLGDRYDSVAEFHKRRNGRLVTRTDENPRLIYQIAKNRGIQTDGLTVLEVKCEVEKRDPLFSLTNGNLIRKDIKHRG